MDRRIKIFDTTLRDGEQSPGFSMNLSEKVEMARQLERLGVDVIEAGFAVSSPEDFESVRTIAGEMQSVQVASLARLVKKDIDAAYEAVKGAQNPLVHTFLATSDIHMKHKLGMTPDQVLDAVKSLVAYARSLCGQVQFSAEDATRSDPAFLAKVLEEAVVAGACVVNVADTVGYTTPTEMYRLIRYLYEHVKGIEKVSLAVHCHNDLGLATANSLAAISAGSGQVDCTVNGIGERAGNASLEEIVMALKTRKDFFGVETGINTRQIYRACKLLSTITGVGISPNKPVVGGNAFAHEAGIHQHGVLKEKATYEIMSPEDIGIYQNRMVLGKHSGRHAFEDRIGILGYKLNKSELDTAFEKFKELADKKKIVTDRDIDALLGSHTIGIAQVYTLETFVVNSGTSISATAAVKLKKDGKSIEKVAAGSGPIDAALKAVEKIVRKGYPLENYSIQSVTEGEDALGEVVVKIKKGEETITGRGLSTDIIEASIKAYLNALNKAE